MCSLLSGQARPSVAQAITWLQPRTSLCLYLFARDTLLSCQRDGCCPCLLSSRDNFCPKAARCEAGSWALMLTGREGALILLQLAVDCPQSFAREAFQGWSWQTWPHDSGICLHFEAPNSTSPLSLFLFDHHCLDSYTTVIASEWHHQYMDRQFLAQSLSISSQPCQQRIALA